MPQALVIDNGLFPDVARNLVRVGYEVGYFSTWGNAFPLSKEMAVGTGIEGVQRVDRPIAAIREMNPDLIVIPDLYLEDYDVLSRSLEIPTVSAGGGSRLETDRWFLKEFLEERGLNVIKSIEIAGIDELGEYLQKNEDKYIKVSIFRGDMETRHHRDWASSEAWFDDLKHRLGPIGKTLRFVVEDPIPDALEIGIDGWVSDGVLLEPFLVGAEIKDAGYCGYVCNSVKELPEQVQAIISTCNQYFRETRYRNFYSNEMRILPNGEAYMTDATCRVPSPPGGILMAACKNLGEVLKAIGHGKRAVPDFGDAEYLAELVMKSIWLEDHFLEVRVPNDADYTFHNYCIIDGHTWVIPHDSHMIEFGSSLGKGTLEGALKHAQKAAEEAQAECLEFGANALEKAKEAMAEAARMGFKL